MDAAPRMRSSSRATARSALRGSAARSCSAALKLLESVEKRQLIPEDQYRSLEKLLEVLTRRLGKDTHEWVRAGLGAAAIKELLEEIDLDKLARELRQEIAHTQGPRRARAIKRLEIVRGVHQEQGAPGVDDPGRGPGHPAGAAADGPARRRPLRDLRPERSLPADHQPEQPAEEDRGDPRAGVDRQPREAAAAGGGGRADRQRPAHAPGGRLQQPRRCGRSPTC